MKIHSESHAIINAVTLRDLCIAEFSYIRPRGSDKKFGIHYNKMKDLKSTFNLRDLNEEDRLFYYLDKLGVITVNSDYVKARKVVTSGKSIDIHQDRLKADRTSQLLLLILLCKVVELTQKGALSPLAIKVATEALPLLTEICSKENIVSEKNEFLLKTLREFGFYLMDTPEPTSKLFEMKPFQPPRANTQELQIIVRSLIDIAHLPTWVTSNSIESFFKRLLSDELELMTSIKKTALRTSNPTIGQLGACVEQFERSNPNQSSTPLKAYCNLVINLRDLIRSESGYNDLACFVNEFLTQHKIVGIRQLPLKPEQTLTRSNPIDIPKSNTKK